MKNNLFVLAALVASAAIAAPAAYAKGAASAGGRASVSSSRAYSAPAPRVSSAKPSTPSPAVTNPVLFSGSRSNSSKKECTEQQVARGECKR